MTRAALDGAILEMIREGVDAPRDDARFGALALDLFEHQYTCGEIYRNLCRAQGVSPPLEDWTQIPLVPTGAFKEARLACFPAESTVRVFRTSGTTTTARGELHLDTLALYEASLIETFRAFLCPEVASGERLPLHVLAPSPDDAPDSSLAYMFGEAVRRLGSETSRFWLHPERAPAFDPEACARAIGSVKEPMLLAGTAFAFVHLLDWLEARGLRLSLPTRSRIMETGGFKGRSRELPRAELYAAIADRLGVPEARIVNQYGMCELGSQLYEPSLREGEASEWKVGPPWMRTRALDPETLRAVPEEEIGVLAHYDLANTGSVLAVLTSDLGRVHDGRVRVEGRAPGAEARGCSRAADALLLDRARSLRP